MLSYALYIVHICRVCLSVSLTFLSNKCGHYLVNVQLIFYTQPEKSEFQLVSKQ